MIKLHNYLIITQNAKRDVFVGDVEIGMRKIIKIRRKSYSSPIQGVILPGLINLHAHLGEIFFRGCWQRINLKNYISKTERINDQIQDCDFRESVAKLTLSEMIRSGTTSVVGGRISESLKYFDMTGLSLSPVMKSKKLAYLYNKKISSDNLRPESGYFIHSISYVDEAKLKEISKTLKENQNKLFVMAHVAETYRDTLNCKRTYNKTEIELLNEYGLISDKTILVHCNYCTTRDLEIIRKMKATIVSCPISNKRINSKLLSLDKLSGINLVISTDGAGTNDSLDLFMECKFAYLQNNNLTSQNLLDMVTVNAAKAIGFDEKIGSIEIGKEANVIILEKSSYVFPTRNIINNIILNPPVSTIKKVIIRGEVFYNKGFVSRYKKDLDKCFNNLEELWTKLKFY